MKTYKQKKDEFLRKNPKGNEFKEGMEAAEHLIETCIREDMTAVSVLINQLHTLLDTKCEGKKVDIEAWLRMNPNLPEATENLKRLINICRL